MIKLYHNWIQDTLNKGLQHVNVVVETFKRHEKGIENTFITQSNSGKHENLNGRIQAVLVKARGSSNFKRFKINVMFYFGDLDFIPLKIY